MVGCSLGAEQYTFERAVSMVIGGSFDIKDGTKEGVRMEGDDNLDLNPQDVRIMKFLNKLEKDQEGRVEKKED